MNKITTIVAIASGAIFTTALALPIQPVRGTPASAVPGSGGARVVFDGEKPEIKPLEIDPKKAEGCGTVETQNQSLILDASGGIANVVVTVEVPGTEAKPAEKPLELDQKTCRFDTHVAVVTVGTTVEFKNSDKISHNVHTYPGKNEQLNKMISPDKGETQKLDKEDRVEVKCDIHPWMNSWIIVVNTPYFAVTGSDGSFSFKGLPAGEYKAKFWHETLGKAEATIKVGADGKVEPVEVKMSAEKKGGRRR